MANASGDFIWYELLTTDLGAAARFYGAVLGWRTRSMDGSEKGYRLFGTGETDVAGSMEIPVSQSPTGMRPMWLGYVAVDDVDAAVARIVAAGGAKHLPPADVPGVGRFSMVGDPQGALFYVMRGAVEGGTSTSFHPSKAGHCQWNELAAKEPAAALSFYGSHFGWEKGDAMPMGELGDYQFLQHHGQTFGALMRQPTEALPPRWMFYFGVEDIDAATATATREGAKLLDGPSEVPGDIFTSIVEDPQGATFGLVGPRKK
ncbi:VOC family protein [Stigmatella hybrida]|uniref:VOC family protein n=1 Tax=Stigmatella hybrida TaxID=394097 RepID=UPI001CDAF4D0|nr:VOC family protein [Stigmatella hybrida]